MSDVLALSNVQGETLAKYVSDLFQGKSLTVSLSADEQVIIIIVTVMVYNDSDNNTATNNNKSDNRLYI